MLRALFWFLLWYDNTNNFLNSHLDLTIKVFSSGKNEHLFCKTFLDGCFCELQFLWKNCVGILAAMLFEDLYSKIILLKNFLEVIFQTMVTYWKIIMVVIFERAVIWGRIFRGRYALGNCPGNSCPSKDQKCSFGWVQSLPLKTFN